VLIAAVATPTAECTSLMNQQFLALMANDTDIGRFDVLIATATEKRKRTMVVLLDHVRFNGW
jgi:hypothetical protein